MNPFLPLIGAHLLALTLYPFLANRTIFRLGILALVVLCCVISLQSVDKQTWWGTDFAQYTCGFMLNMNYFLFLRKGMDSSSSSHSSQAGRKRGEGRGGGGEGGGGGGGGRRLERFIEVQTALFNSRSGIAVKDLPTFRRGEPAAYFPSRKEFLIHRSCTFAWTASAFLFAHSRPLVLWQDDFASPKDQLLRRIFDVSLREWIILIHTAFQIWFKPYCLLNAAHCFVSVIAIALGDSPAHWRPLFGDIREAYTLQRFYG